MSNTASERSLSKLLPELYELYFEHGCRVATDSRLVSRLPGCVFFALPGERFDGNDYARQALAEGAVAAVVTRLPTGIQEGTEEAERYFVVQDTLSALQALAQLHRQTLGLPIVALSGSNGKTTTKELILCVLRTKYRVAATVGNLNNHIGVPLTLLSFTEEDDIGVVEMGANHPGEIAQLCRIAEPNIGLLTNVGSAHLEGFGGPEGVRRAKGELYDYLSRTGGTVIYSTTDQVLAEMVAERDFLSGSRRGYGVADFGIKIQETHLSGAYNVANIAAALAVGDYFGVEVAVGLRAAAAYRPDNNRSQRVVSARTGNTLYMDAYNANPSSMRASLEHFLGLEAPDKVLILGDMRELGEFSAAEHRIIVEGLLPALRAEKLRAFFVGEHFGAAVMAVGLPVTTFQDVEALKAFLQTNPLRGRTVLIKGSRGMALEKLYDLL